MHVVVIGAGRIGLSLARVLVNSGHEIAVIEEDQSRCLALDEVLGSVSVVGNCVDASTLSKAGANRADVLVATSSKDDVNMVACELAKHHFGIPRTISIVNIRDHAELFEMLGIDVAIDETELIVGHIQQGLSSDGLVHLMSLSNSQDTRLVAIKIPRRYGREGRAIKEIPLPAGTFISLMITKDGDVFVPDEDALIRAGDEVVAVTNAQRVDELRDLIIGSAQQ